MSGSLPNFLIVGAARSGTTSLFYYLKEHPDVYIHSRKEGMFFSSLSTHCAGPGRYFNDSVVTSLEAYRSLFSDLCGESAIGDVSPDYLYCYEESIRNISRVLGNDVRIVIVLRNPVDRVFSQYAHHRKYGLEPLSLEDALCSEARRKAANWFWTYQYRDVGLYHAQVAAYLDRFPSVAVYLYEDLDSDAARVVESIFSFLGVDSTFKPDVSFRYLASGVPGNRAVDLLVRGLRSPVAGLLTKPLYRLLKRGKRSRQLLERSYASLFHGAVAHADLGLRDFYAEDVAKLQALIGRDLSAWLA